MPVWTEITVPSEQREGFLPVTTGKNPYGEVLSAKAFFEPRQRPPLLQRSLFPADAGVGGGAASDSEEDLSCTAQDFWRAVERQELQQAELCFNALSRSSVDHVQRIITVADDDGNTALHRSVTVVPPLNGVEEQHAARVTELLLRARATVDTSNVLGETPLVAAVRAAGTSEVVQVLLKAQADPNHQDSMRETALMEAACSGAVDLCRCLLDARADPLLQNMQGLTAWDLAQQSGSAKFLEDLPLRPEISASEAPVAPEHDFRAELRAAVRVCDLERLTHVLEELPVPTEILAESDGSGRTLLHLCTTWSNCWDAIEAVRKLLASSASCEVMDAFGRTPLEVAIEAAAARDLEDPEPVLTLCEALLPRKPSKKVFLDKPTANTAIGRAILTLLQDREVAVEVEGEDSSELMEENGLPGCGESSKRVGSALRRRCEQLGLPLDKLGTFAAAPLLSECERLCNLSLPELQMEWRQSCACEDPPGKDIVEKKDQLIERLKQLAIWRALPTSELQDQCRCVAAELAANSAHRAGRALDREELVEVLAVATWGGLMRSEALQDECAAKGIPMSQLGLEEAERLLSARAALEKMSLEELRAECRKQHLAPLLKASKVDLVKQLSELLLWSELPLSALRSLCKEKGLPIRGDQRRTGLLRLLREESWRLRGIPLEKIEHETVAQDLLDQVETFESQNIDTLRSKCRAELGGWVFQFAGKPHGLPSWQKTYPPTKPLLSR